MNQITIPFPWYVLIDPEDESLLVVTSDETPMVAVFTSKEFADLYNERCDSQFIVNEIPDISEAIEFLDHVSTVDPSDESDHVLYMCLDPIDPFGDEEGSAFEIKTLLSELRKLST